jgi:hypothetical protein
MIKSGDAHLADVTMLGPSWLEDIACFALVIGLVEDPIVVVVVSLDEPSRGLSSHLPWRYRTGFVVHPEA